MSQYDRPFDEYERLQEDRYNYNLNDNPLDYQDDFLAQNADLPFMEITEEMLEGSNFYDESLGGEISRSGYYDSEYQRVHYYNQLIGDGVSEQKALEWYEENADTNANQMSGNYSDLVRSDYVEKQSTYFRALDNLREENPSQYEERLGDASFGEKMNYLNHLHDTGEISEEQYKNVYIETYNNDQRNNSDQPQYIVQAQAVRDSVEQFGREEENKYKAGDDIYILYDPENPPGDVFPVVNPSNFSPSSNQHQYQGEVGYTVGDRPATEFSRGDERSDWVKARDGVIKPLIRVALMFTPAGPYVAAADAAYKVATGQTLKTEDYANLALAGLHYSEVIVPPTTEVDAVTGLETVVDYGQGLAGLDYGQTIAVINGTINEDPLAAILGGTNILPTALATAGIPQELINDPDFMAGVTRSVETLASGEDIQQALEDGLSKYVREGGGFGVDLPDGSSFDIDLGFLGDALSSVGTAIGDIGSAVGNYLDPVFGAIGDAGAAFGDLVDPVIQVGQDAIDAGSQVVGDVSSAVGDVIDPALGAVGDAGSAVDDTVRAGGRAVGDYLDPVWSFIGDNLVLTEGGAQAQQQQQRTPTQNLFDSELKSIGSISLSEYAPLLTGDQRRHAPVAPVGTAANPARQQPQTTAESLLKPLSTQFAGQLAQDPIRQQMEKDRLASQGSLYENLNSNPFASPFDTEEEEGLI